MEENNKNNFRNFIFWEHIFWMLFAIVALCIVTFKLTQIKNVLDVDFNMDDNEIVNFVEPQTADEDFKTDECFNSGVANTQCSLNTSDEKDVRAPEKDLVTESIPTSPIPKATPEN